jgi:hypothetical protein
MTTTHIKVNINAYSAVSAPSASCHRLVKNFFMHPLLMHSRPSRTAIDYSSRIFRRQEQVCSTRLRDEAWPDSGLLIPAEVLRMGLWPVRFVTPQKPFAPSSEGLKLSPLLNRRL